VEAICVDTDIKEYICKHATNIPPPGTIEYVPFAIQLRQKPIELSNYPAESVINVIVSLTETFENVDGKDSVSFI
jgi:hypothetical protein